MKQVLRDALLKKRKQFPIVEKSTYLISNSLGAMPGEVYQGMFEYADDWAKRGVRAWSEKWWELPVTTGNAIAPLIGAGNSQVSMHVNISLLQAILISSFSFKKKKRYVVCSDMEFPSVNYVYQRFARSMGAKIRMVYSDDGITMPPEKIMRAIDDNTLLVPISHVLFKSAYIQDVKSIAEKAHRHGAIVILDTYHSAGIIPVDVKELGVDILVGGVLKWLCGGPGGAFLWIQDSLRKKLNPNITGWLAHKNPFDFTQEMEYTESSFRFFNGTPPISALYAAPHGAKIIAGIGTDKIRRKSIRQTSLLIEKAQEYGFGVVSPMNPEQRAGTVTLTVPHGFEVSREMLRREIIVDYRKGAGIRIAPHFYNSDEEVVYAIEQIKDILDTKAYRSTRTKSRRVKKSPVT